MHITILEVIEEIKINILYHLYKMKVNSESLEILIILSKWINLVEGLSWFMKKNLLKNCESYECKNNNWWKYKDSN